MSYSIVSGGVWRIYNSLLHWKNTLISRDADLHNKISAIEGKLMSNYCHVVGVEKAAFSIPIAIGIVPKVDAVITALSADSNIALIGSDAVSANGTESLKVRNIYPSPPPGGGSSTTRWYYGRNHVWRSTPP